MEYIYDITLHLIPSGEIPVVRVKQGDASTRFIKATVMYGDQIYIPGGEQTILFREEKPDGTGVMTDSRNIDVELGRYLVGLDENGAVVVELTDQMTACRGYCRCDICFVRNAEIISTATFVLDVEAAPDVAGLAVSGDDFRSLVNALDHVWEAGVVALPGAAASGSVTLGPTWTGSGPYKYVISRNILPQLANFPSSYFNITLDWNSEHTQAHITGTGFSYPLMIGLYDNSVDTWPGAIRTGKEYAISFTSSDPNIRLYAEHNGVQVQPDSHSTMTFSSNDSFWMALEVSANAVIDGIIQIWMREAVAGYTPTATTVVNIVYDEDVISKMVADGVTKLYIVNTDADLTAYATGAKPNGTFTVPVVYLDQDEATYRNVRDGQVIAYDGRTLKWVNKDLDDYGYLKEPGVRTIVTSYGYQTETQVRQLIQNYVQALDGNNTEY